MSSPLASQVFSAHAAEYTALRRRIVPGFDALYGTALSAIECASSGPIARVLDVGAGTGLMSSFVAERYPDAQFELLDGSAEMLVEARERLDGRLLGVHVQDMADGLPDGPFDAVISGLAIHHLEDPQKRALFAEIYRVLAPGGVFTNAEQVAGPTEALTLVYDQRYAEQCRELGATEEEIAAAFERRKVDRCASVEDQLAWLRQGGFEWADCFYKDWGLAVLAAKKGEAR